MWRAPCTPPLIVLLVIGGIFAGCPSKPRTDAGSATEVEFDGGPHWAEAQQFCAQYAAARCALRQRCGALRSTEWSLCEAAERSACFETGRLVANDSARLDPEAGAECLRVLAVTTECRLTCNPFELGGPIGGPCAYGVACREGLCDSAAPGCARCRPFAAIGEPCAPSVEGAWPCDFKTGYCPTSVVGGVCLPLKARGEPCLFRQECGGDSDCVDGDGGGLRCDARQHAELPAPARSAALCLLRYLPVS